MSEAELLDPLGELNNLITCYRNTFEPRNYFSEDKKLIPKLLAEHIMETDYFKFDGNFLYCYDSGVYREVNEIVIRKRCMTLLGNLFKKSIGDEVVHYIKVGTYQQITAVNEDTTYINVKNGLLEWKTRQLHPHNPDYFTTTQLPIQYNEELTSKKIDAFFHSIVPSDTVPTLYEWFGYSMLPTTCYEKAVMLHGEGANGKSKLIELYENFIGKDNISNIPLHELENNRFKLAQLYGKLANVFADISAKGLDKSNVFKTVVSGDGTSAEFKGKDSFNFKPYARLTFSANELPRSADLTNGFFRKWIIIPFPNKFGSGGQKADPKIMEKLTTEEELSGLLNSALDALDGLEKQGHFTENDSTKVMMEQYKMDIDNVATFVDEMCLLTPEVTITKQVLYKDYSDWCSQSGYKPIGLKKFYHRIEKDYVVTTVRPSGQPRSYVGISTDYQGKAKFTSVGSRF